MTKHDQGQIYSMQKLSRNTPLEYNVVLLYKQSAGVGSNGRWMYIICSLGNKRNGKGTD